MNLFNIRKYTEIVQISVITVMTFYIMPLNFLLGDYQGVIRNLLFSIVFWTLAWKVNATLHQLLEKWEWKKK